MPHSPAGCTAASLERAPSGAKWHCRAGGPQGARVSLVLASRARGPGRQCRRASRRRNTKPGSASAWPRSARGPGSLSALWTWQVGQLLAQRPALYRPRSDGVLQGLPLGRCKMFYHRPGRSWQWPNCSGKLPKEQMRGLCMRS